MGITKFYYRNTIEDTSDIVLTDDTFWINDCPIYPFTSSLVQSATSSEFQDNYIIARPLTSMNLSLYTLNFVAVSVTDMLTIKKLEYLVRGAGTFYWLPTVPLTEEDLDDNGNLKSGDYDGAGSDGEKERLKSVRFVTSVKYSLDACNLYSFTLNLQEADKYS